MSENPRQPPARRWFQFRLRTLLIAVAVLAVPCAWVGYHLNWIRERQAVSRLRCFYGNPFGGSDSPPWPLMLFGESGQPYIRLESPSAEEAERVKRAFPEAEVAVFP